MSEKDTAEAKRRAEWLHKHKAHKDWVILSVSEISVIRAELEATERERDAAQELAKEADLGHDMAISDLRKCETELAEATTKLAEISSLTESIVEKANALIARWDQPSWKDTAPTARFINALRIAVRAYERNLK